MINDFEYFAPKTLKEALTLLDQYRDDYKVIAGLYRRPNDNVNL